MGSLDETLESDLSLDHTNIENTNDLQPPTVLTTTAPTSITTNIQPVPKPESKQHENKAEQSSQIDNKKKRLFSKELRCMMYGFGDDQNPYTETVDMLEDLVINFIGNIALEALEIGRTGRVTVEDVMYLVRRDARKYARVKDLLSMNEELKRARKAFDEVEYVQKKKKLNSKITSPFKPTHSSSGSLPDLKKITE